MNNPVASAFSELYKAKAVIDEINTIYEDLKEEDETRGLNPQEEAQYKLIKHIIKKYEEV